jgi:hypothetical protein
VIFRQVEGTRKGHALAPKCALGRLDVRFTGFGAARRIVNEGSKDLERGIDDE